MSSATALASVEASPRTAGLASVRVVGDPVPVLDTARFEHMQRIATLMASTTLVPESLRGERKGKDFTPYPPNEVLANCFLVTNQAVRWGLDPFAVAQCCSVVHGKLTYEGKLVAAVLDAKIGVRLKYEWTDADEKMTIRVSGVIDGVTETIEGSVADWKTTGNNTPWTPKQYRKMLAYRGAREWARLYAPAVMLGVYADDEMDRLDAASRSAPPPAPAIPPPAAPVRSRAAETIEPQEIGSRAQSPPPAPPSAGVVPTPAAAPPAARPAGPPSPPAPSAKPPAGNPPPAARPAQGDLLVEPDPGAKVADVISDFEACGDLEMLNEVWLRFEDIAETMSRNDRQAVSDAYDHHAKRIKKGA